MSRPYREGEWAPHHPIADQGAPTIWRPLWRVSNLVYQSGVPRLPVSPIAGGGFLYKRDLAGWEGPGWQPFVAPVSSAVGPGALPSRPNFLTRLLGGTQGNIPV